VLVTNGIYTTGGRLGHGVGLTNRVVLDKPITLQSVGGPLVTVIQGSRDPGIIYGPAAVRCVYMTNGATLIGFTLTNGHTLGSSAVDPKNTQNGGGVFCEWTTCLVSNCVLVGNAAYTWGGGAESGTFNNCSFIRNSAQSGGGSDFANLNNCLLVSNSVSSQGGGAVRGTLNNCTIVGNSANTGGGVYGDTDGIINNSILYYNSAVTGPNYYLGSAYNNCCTIPSPGSNSISNAPQFLDQAGGNFRLQPNSRCINAGYNTYAVGTDLDFNARIAGGTVDIGAFEFATRTTGSFAAWLQLYHLPTTGSADFLDTDGDGLNNCQEWLAGTVPTNALSVLKMSAVTNDNTGTTVTWQSVPGRPYVVQRSAVLAPHVAFFSIQSNIIAVGTNTSYKDTSVSNSSSYFYRVGVQ
jgi:hypothetical protein